MQASLLATLHVAAGFLAGAAAKTGVTLTRRQAMAAAQLGAADLLLGDIPWNLTLDQDLLEHLKASFARVPAVLSGIGTAHAFVNVTSNGAGGGGGGAAAAVLLADVTVPVTVSGGGSGGGGRSQLTSLTTLLTTDPIMQVCANQRTAPVLVCTMHSMHNAGKTEFRSRRLGLCFSSGVNYALSRTQRVSAARACSRSLQCSK